MSGKRSFLSEESSLIIQKACGKTDDYNPAVRLEYTIEEPVLRDFVADSVQQLEALGYRLDD